jgi:hypothetical protein
MNFLECRDHRAPGLAIRAQTRPPHANRTILTGFSAINLIHRWSGSHCRPGLTHIEELMEIAAIAVAVLGIVVGAMFRLKVLLAFVGLVLVVSIILSLSCGFSFLETSMTILVAQIILQSSYFLGLVSAAALAGSHRVRHHAIPRR